MSGIELRRAGAVIPVANELSASVFPESSLAAHACCTEGTMGAGEVLPRTLWPEIAFDARENNLRGQRADKKPHQPADNLQALVAENAFDTV